MSVVSLQTRSVGSATPASAEAVGSRSSEETISAVLEAGEI
eukprot:COSAG04_NODE_1565_length_6321_cov_5.077306_2_plen_41_part_00